MLWGLLAFGLFLSLPSPEVAFPYHSESNRADHLLAKAPFTIVANDRWRAVRNKGDDQTDNDAGHQPALLWLLADIFQPAVHAAPLLVSSAPGLPPLPVSSLPGAPRAPPAFPL